jgi:hypothetical protein
MILVRLTCFSGFMQVLYSKKKLTIKNEHFPMHILFTIIYLLQEQKLNHNNYSEHKINMIYFIKSKEYSINMQAKI